MNFEWDPKKDWINRQKHGISFSEAQHAFADPMRVVARNISHSTEQEQRYYCFGMVDGRVMTVRFTYRDSRIRIYGAGFWREGRKRYEKENKL